MNVRSYKDARQLLGKTVLFTAVCDLFPCDGIKGKLIGLDISTTNELVYIINKNGKRYTIGANTAGLSVQTL
jgi:hypothetical protein